MSLRKPIVTYTLTSQTATTAATGSSGTVTLRDFDYNSLVFNLIPSSVSATATLDVFIQSSLDGGTTWYDVLRFPRVTASAATPLWGAASSSALSVMGTVGASTISSTTGGTGVPLLSNTIQVYWSLGGTTPSASFVVNAFETTQNGAGN